MKHKILKDEIDVLVGMWEGNDKDRALAREIIIESEVDENHLLLMKKLFNFSIGENWELVIKDDMIRMVKK